jgi:hypothetical protein
VVDEEDLRLVDDVGFEFRARDVVDVDCNDIVLSLIGVVFDVDIERVLLFDCIELQKEKKKKGRKFLQQ